jgi:hypothetical protein
MNLEEPIPDTGGGDLSEQVEELKKAIQVSFPDDDKLQNWFTYHPPTLDDVDKYKRVRDAGLAFARVIRDDCPPGADATTAIRKVREAVMTANASIACCGH